MIASLLLCQLSGVRWRVPGGLAVTRKLNRTYWGFILLSLEPWLRYITDNSVSIAPLTHWSVGLLCSPCKSDNGILWKLSKTNTGASNLFEFSLSPPPPPPPKPTCQGISPEPTLQFPLFYFFSLCKHNTETGNLITDFELCLSLLTAT